MCELNCNAVHTMQKLENRFKIQKKEFNNVSERFPVKTTPYYLGLIREQGDGIWKQCMPDIREITMTEGFEDPLHEEKDSPIPGLTHRYPDRLLLLISNACAVYCRFCTRKRRIKNEASGTVNIEDAIEYIKAHKEVRDILLSGGDPFMLSTEQLEFYIKKIRSIKHIDIIRIGTRIPCVDPMRIDEKLCTMLKKYHPVYINVHFNHPYEITPESRKACEMLSDAGIPLGNQSVLLKGVNDDPKIMKKLVLGLLKMRVKPYYIFIPDIVRGTHHFRTKIDVGLKIIDSIRGWTSGMAVPQLVLDINGGGGKIPLLPEYLVSREANNYVFRNYEGTLYDFTDI